MNLPGLKHFALLGALSMVLAAPAPAALSPEDRVSIREVKEETRDLVETISNYGADRRDEALEEIEIAILRLDRRIDSLEKRIEASWDGMTGQARDSARSSLDSLHRQREELAVWYRDLEASSASAWKDIRRGFSEAYSDVNKAWENALDRFADSDNS